MGLTWASPVWRLQPDNWSNNHWWFRVSFHSASSLVPSSGQCSATASPFPKENVSLHICSTNYNQTLLSYHRVGVLYVITPAESRPSGQSEKPPSTVLTWGDRTELTRQQHQFLLLFTSLWVRYCSSSSFSSFCGSREPRQGTFICPSSSVCSRISLQWNNRHSRLHHSSTLALQKYTNTNVNNRRMNKRKRLTTGAYGESTKFLYTRYS